MNVYFGGPWRTYEDEYGIYDIDTHLMYEYFVDAPVEEKKVVKPEIKRTFFKKPEEPVIRYYFVIEAIKESDSYFKMKVEKIFRDTVVTHDKFAFKDYPDFTFKVVMNPERYGSHYIYPFKFLSNVCDMSLIRPGALFYRVN